MNRTIRKTAAFAAVILSVGAVTALAANSPPLVGVPKGAMNGVHRATGANGALKANAVGNRQIKFGSVSCRKLSADLAAALCTGKPGAPGTPGAPGADGNAGSPGKNGGLGSNGDKGGPGTNGSNGSKGDKGDNAPAAQYGAAQVLVARHGGTVAAPTFNATPWATYSTLLGSPVGDNTGGTFRFTCGDAQSPCEISVKASVIGSADHSVYPRLLIYTESLAGGPEMYCEYADGSTGVGGNGAPLNIAHSAMPAYANVPVNIGGTADCSGPDPTAGNVSVITVPAGYYDVHSTFVFAPAA
jgi:hypothetical protein